MMNDGQSMTNTGFFPQQLEMNARSQYLTEDLKSSKVQSIMSMVGGTKINYGKYFQEYVPCWRYFEIGKLRESGKLILKKYKESVYYGEVVDGKRQGMGIMLYNNNRIYEGEWKGDYKHGKGFEKFSNSSIYEGNYVNGKAEGVGKYCWQNGEFYEGEWSNGLKQGSGMWRGSKGDSYIGQWKCGKADGYGVHTWINGDKYEGQFKQCLKHGEGIEKFANGDIYKGFYLQGKPSGYGQYYWQNGSYFKGLFNNGLRNGKGVWKRGTGTSDRFEGEYISDKKCGYGVFTWATGNIYKGNYDSDVRNGYGEMYWNDGSYYKGNWQKGIQHGQGTIYVPGQGLKKGIFENNVLVIVEWQSQVVSAPNILIEEQGHHRGVSDPQKYSQGKVSKNNGRNNGIPSGNINFRRRELSSKNKPVEGKIVDENMKTRKNVALNNNHLIAVKNHKCSNQNYPFLHQKFNQKPASQAQRNQKHKKSQTRERILHSSFYMHKLHNRINTKITNNPHKTHNSNNTNNTNNNNNNIRVDDGKSRWSKDGSKGKIQLIGSQGRIDSKSKIGYF